MAAFCLNTNAACHGAGEAWDRVALARPLGMRIRTRALASEPDDAVAERTARRGLAESLDQDHAGPAATTTCCSMATRGPPIVLVGDPPEEAFRDPGPKGRSRVILGSETGARPEQDC